MEPPLTHHVRFADPRYAAVELPDGASLSVVLDVTNSPVLFGCRTGLCGTCCCAVSGDLPPAGPDEREVIEALDITDPRARLLCQITLHGDLRIEAVLD